MRGSCVTNASPSGLRSCMEDEGQALRSRLSGAGFKPPQAAKSRCRERWGKDTGQVGITETSGSEPLMTGRKVPWRPEERVSLLGQGWEVPDDTGVRHEGG